MNSQMNTENTKPEQDSANVDKANETKQEVESMQPVKQTKAMKKMVMTAVLVILGVLFLGLGLGGYWLVYKYSGEHPAQRWIASTLPLSLAKVNGQAVTIDEYLYNLDSSTKFLQSDAFQELGLGDSITQDDLVDLEYQRLINKAILEQYAKTQDVSVSSEEIDKYFDEEILPQAEGGLDEVTQVFEDSYGWTVDEFKQNIAGEVLLRQKLSDKLSSDEGMSAEAEQKAKEVRAEIDANPERSFADFATEYSEDPGSASAGGSLGSFAKGVMVAEFEDAAFGLEVGQVSEPIKTAYGYHIIKVTAKDEAAGTVEASHI
ncbi:MAG: hypothetical protein COW24_05875, partial [Candidatus Kerfeldbacteria bacterium CG15_BIG_FIL_POST_REV_8_21_14_020_45_12]